MNTALRSFLIWVMLVSPALAAGSTMNYEVTGSEAAAGTIPMKGANSGPAGSAAGNLVASPCTVSSGNMTCAGLSAFSGGAEGPPDVTVASSGNLDPTTTAICSGTVDSTASSPITLTILSTWPANCSASIVALGAGLVTIAGTPVHSACSPIRTRAQYSTIHIHGYSTGNVVVSGDCG